MDNNDKQQLQHVQHDHQKHQQQQQQRRPSMITAHVQMRRASSAEQLAANAPTDDAMTGAVAAGASAHLLSRPLRIQIPEIDQQNVKLESLEPLMTCQRLLQADAQHQRNTRVPNRKFVAGGSSSTETAAVGGAAGTAPNCCDPGGFSAANHCCQIGCGTTPPISSVVERFVLQQHAAGGVPKKKPPQHRRLRKYASETSFCSSPASSIGSASGLGLALAAQQQQFAAAAHQRMPHSARAARTQLQQSREQLLLDDDTPSPPLIITTGMPLIMPISTGADREVRSGTSGRIFHVRGSGGTGVGAPVMQSSAIAQLPAGGGSGGGRGGAVLTRLQQQTPRRGCSGGTTPTTTGAVAAALRHDSADEASAASMGSVSTVGSGAAPTPQMQRRAATIAAQQLQLTQQQQRFKMRRPKSTGQIIIQQQQQHQQMAQNHRKKLSEIQPQHGGAAMQDRNSVGTAGTGQSGGSGSLTLAPGGGVGRVHQQYQNMNTIPHQQNNNNNNNAAVAYDPSYTSATVYSDSITCLHVAGVLQPGAGGGASSCADGMTDQQRRGSNYYFLEDDSTHEFDDEGISPDFGRRRSLHTGAPAIAFRSTLSFAAAVAGANAGRIGGVALGGGTTARNSACQQQRRPLFQRRSSQPIIYSGAAGPAFSAAGMRYTPNHQHQHRAVAMQQQQKAAAADQNNRFQQCRFNIGMSGSPISVGGGGGICAGTDSGGSGGTPISCGGKISASGVPTLHGATMHGPPTSFLAKRVSWLSMKSLQDCAATQQQLHHKHASAEQCTLRGGGQDNGGGAGWCCTAVTPASILGGSRSRNKRDSASIGAEFGGISGGGAIACKISTDTRSNSQLGSLLQLNNSIGGGGYAAAAGRGGGQSDADELTIGFDPLECPDTPPMDTMSWSNMDEFDNVTLMYSKHEKIPMKDFGSEIRATMDIDHLLNKAVLLLDLQETSLEEIFAKIIHEMDIQEPEFTSEQVRSVLFTQDAGNQFHILSRTVQSICTTGTVGGTFDYDQTWICALCMLNTVQHRHVAIARLSHPTNLGRTMQDLRFIIIVIAPSRAKGTKTALETTRTFATLFADMDIRQRLVMSNTVDMFRATLLEAAKELAMEQSQWRDRKTSNPISAFDLGKFFPFRGMVEDLKRRKRHYVTDYLDGLRGHRTAQKMFSSIIFLYFACLLPAIAFGVLNDDNTGGGINVRKGILAQAIGGIFFAVFGGQPMIILLTTVPLAIYIKVIYRISEALGYDFFAMYACVGLWCQFFLILYAGTELCSLMKLATRSAEEMFSLFIAIAFTVESIRAIHTSFMNNYEVCEDAQVVAEKVELARRQQLMNQQRNLSLLQKIINPELHHNFTQVHYSDTGCHRDTSILYLLLMFGTLWLAMFLYNFRKTPYLTRSRREWLADYALPASVLIMSFIGAYSFSEIDKDMFKMRPDVPLFRIPEFWRLSWQAILVCFLLGFFLSFLFYMDQNICSAIVNNGQNKLKKGSSQHLDMFVVAILNMFLSIVGLPWMHGALPHSPLHLRALADVEERVAQGHVHEVIMNVRETRLATLVAHLLILGSAFCLLPFPLQWIPTSVLHGLFLYMAFTSLTGNEMVERLLLLITEQQAYPPTHYIRRVPQRKVHLFTACQLIQLIILCAVGFSPYPFIEMVFPIVCFCFLPIRHILIPRLIDYKYLDALDGRH